MTYQSQQFTQMTSLKPRKSPCHRQRCARVSLPGLSALIKLESSNPVAIFGTDPLIDANHPNVIGMSVILRGPPFLQNRFIYPNRSTSLSRFTVTQRPHSSSHTSVADVPLNAESKFHHLRLILFRYSILPPPHSSWPQKTGKATVMPPTISSMNCN